MGTNYQKELEKIVDQISKDKVTPTLLLHSCCAPCSSYCIEYLSEYFKITVFFYNPNISPDTEYLKRVEEQKEFIKKISTKNHVEFLEGDYEPELFYECVKGMEQLPEGSIRCENCFLLRLEKAGKIAKEREFDYFTTTLSISPLKNAEKLNEIGIKLEEVYNIMYLKSDFKKKGGYQRSTQLSREYDLYRQDYCGCIFSKVERDRKNR